VGRRWPASSGCRSMSSSRWTWHPYANRGLKDDKAAGIVGWTNQGENDMRALPTGRQVLGGVPFQIASPKAAVVLYSVSANTRSCRRRSPAIKIGRRADALFFLHSLAWGSEKPFKYRVNYDDGSKEDVEIVNWAAGDGLVG